MTAAGFQYVQKSCPPSQSHAAPCRQSEAALSPTPKHPQERKKEEKEKDKWKRQPGDDAWILCTRRPDDCIPVGQVLVGDVIPVREPRSL